MFSASFYKNNEEDQRIDETETYINLKNNHNLTETGIKNIDVESQLEHQFQIQETKESGGILDKINSMKVRFYRTGELNGSIYVKPPLRFSALISIKNDDKYSFIRSILAKLHPCEKDNLNGVSNYRQNLVD